ncbi:MAG: SRPBCC domain-containing protein [Acidobacteriota bacterium]
MEIKTKLHADAAQQDLVITREFDLPLDLLFKAYAEPDIVEQWMGTKVLKHESKKHGAYQFETSDAEGNVVFKANGVIHEFVPDQKITRTFEMENAPYGVQLEFLTFDALKNDASKLTIHVVYESIELRDQMLKLPFAQGINWAHNRLQEVMSKTQ